jgi:alpha-tubulin suppressor-like RCC1 family protein
VHGELGMGNQSDKATPTQVGTATDWSAVSAGGLITFALKTGGALVGFGFNFYGQIGVGSLMPTYVLSPTPIAAPSTFVSVSAGSATGCAVKSDNTLWCWGINRDGQLGDGTQTDRTSPTTIGSGTTWATVFNGTTHACALSTGGAPKCWGDNALGQLGDGTGFVNAPKRIGP